MSAEQATDAPDIQHGTAHRPLSSLLGGGHADTEMEQGTHRWTRRRITILSVVTLAILALLGAGGYGGYRFLAPYYGLGYQTGGSVNVDEVKLTVTSVRCGLDTAPFGQRGTPQGSYCAVVVSAHGNGPGTAFIDLRSWRAVLDVDLTVSPVSDWLEFRNETVLSHRSSTFQLGFDIPDGARISKLTMFIGDKRGSVTVS